MFGTTAGHFHVVVWIILAITVVAGAVVWRLIAQRASAKSNKPAATRRERAMGLWVLALQSALRETLLMLADTKGDQALPWLSEFEDQLIRDAKGTVTEGIPVDDETGLVDSAIDMLKFVFDGVRRDIASNPPKHQ